MLTALLSLSLNFTQLPLPCDADPAKNKELTSEAVSLGKKLLPATRANEPCEMSGTEKRVVVLEPSVLKSGDVTFMVHPRVFGTLDGAWKLVPFAEVGAAKRIAQQIKSHPLVKKVLPGKISCLATTDGDGSTVWLLCRAPGDVPKEDYEWSTPTSGHLEGEITEFEFSVSKGDASCGCEPFSLVNFSVPLAKAPAATVGWCQVKDSNAVKKFLSQTKEPLQLTVARWRDYSAKLRMKDGTTHEEKIKIDGRDCACTPPPACLK
ncbi:MAG: hypothetical protein ACO1OB_24175 [Archangium sp.]